MNQQEVFTLTLAERYMDAAQDFARACEALEHAETRLSDIPPEIAAGIQKMGALRRLCDAAYKSYMDAAMADLREEVTA